MRLTFRRSRINPFDYDLQLFRREIREMFFALHGDQFASGAIAGDNHWPILIALHCAPIRKVTQISRWGRAVTLCAVDKEQPTHVIVK